MAFLVVDTNVLISAAIRPSSAAGRMLGLAQRHYELAFTRESFAELEVTLARSKFDSVLSIRTRRQAIREIRAVARFFRVEGAGPLSRDPRDDTFLHLASAVGARAVVTGDRDLLVLGAFGSVPILSPSRFLRIERFVRRGRSVGQS